MKYDLEPAKKKLRVYEGLRLAAYPDPATKNDKIKKGKPWTIGYGTTKYPWGVAVKKGDTCTKAQAEAWLEFDAQASALMIDKLVQPELTANQISALISLCYNIGDGAFRGSTLLRYLNQGRFQDAAAQFPRWNKANGKVMGGLTKRRESERKLFLS